MKLKIKKETCSWKGVKEAPRKLRVEVYFSGILTIHRVFPDPGLWSRSLGHLSARAVSGRSRCRCRAVDGPSWVSGAGQQHLACPPPLGPGSSRRGVGESRTRGVGVQRLKAEVAEVTALQHQPQE